MNTSGTPISVIAPLRPAIERAKTILFNPFNLEKWVVIGFCAWLAMLGQHGASGSNFYTGGGRGKPIREAVRDAKEFVTRNLDWLVPVVVGVAVVGLILWVVITWLSSRGHFMFLHCVAGNRAEVAVPWRSYGGHGDSLFFFRLMLGVLGVVGIVPLLIIGGLQYSHMVSGDGAGVMAVARLLAIGLFVVIIGVVFAVVGKLTKDFVVPIMFLRTNRCLTAWNQFSALFSAHLGWFVLYLLFQIVLKLAIGLLVIVAVLITCCLLGCLLIIPFVGTVVLLPILVFERSYSLYFLAQFGTAYDVFAVEPPGGG